MLGLGSWGLYIGRISGIEVRLHWTLLAFWAFELDSWIRRASEAYRTTALLAWATVVVALFGSILLHELGHAFAARRVGGYADEILLWPLGGLASCRTANHWKPHLIVAAAGPAVTLVIVAVCWPLFLGLDAWLRPESWTSITGFVVYETASEVLARWNAYILVFNLIPLYPLDGGRILHSALWGYFSRSAGYSWGAYGRASRITLIVSRVTGVAGIVYGASVQSLWLIVIFVWALLGSESLRRGEDY